MRKKNEEPAGEEAPRGTFDLYVPSWAEQNGPSQPLATALPLDMGKNLCHQNFLQRCRTIKFHLPPEQQVEVSALAIEKLSLEWNLADSGVLEGQPKTSLPQPLASITHIVYTLNPVK